MVVMPDLLAHLLGIGYSSVPRLHETYEKSLSSVSCRLFLRNPRNSILETDMVPVSSVSRKLRQVCSLRLQCIFRGGQTCHRRAASWQKQARMLYVNRRTAQVEGRSGSRPGDRPSFYALQR